MFALVLRATIYKYPFNVINWVRLLLISASMSAFIGAVFVGTRWRYWDPNWERDSSFGQENISDPLGFYNVLMAAGV